MQIQRESEALYVVDVASKCMGSTDERQRARRTNAEGRGCRFQADAYETAMPERGSWAGRSHVTVAGGPRWAGCSIFLDLSNWLTCGQAATEFIRAYPPLCLYPMHILS